MYVATSRQPSKAPLAASTWCVMSAHSLLQFGAVFSHAQQFLALISSLWKPFCPIYSSKSSQLSGRAVGKDVKGLEFESTRENFFFREPKTFQFFFKWGKPNKLLSGNFGCFLDLTNKKWPRRCSGRRKNTTNEIIQPFSIQNEIKFFNAWIIQKHNLISSLKKSKHD